MLEVVTCGFGSGDALGSWPFDRSRPSFLGRDRLREPACDSGATAQGTARPDAAEVTTVDGGTDP